MQQSQLLAHYGSSKITREEPGFNVKTVLSCQFCIHRFGFNTMNLSATPLRRF